MASSYVTTQRFILLTTIVEERIAELRARSPGYLEAILEAESRNLEDSLRHRYAIPFPSNHPTIEKWIVLLVQPEVALKAGYDPNDVAYQGFVRLYDVAREQIAMAAKPESTGVSLPLVSAQDSSAISKGGPFGYAESSPYTWTDEQALGGRYE